jgi:hypothetical protein
MKSTMLFLVQEQEKLMQVHAVARNANGSLDLASLVPNAGGFEPDPIQRIRDSRADIAVKQLPHIDVDAVFKKIPAGYHPIYAELGSYWSRYGEF